jgi:hypothetical protein
MVKLFPRLLLACAALLLFLGGLLHASAFNKVLSALASASELQPFAANSLKILWLGDSATSIALAAVFGFIAARPSAATKWVVIILALIPAVTAALIYLFIGSFIGGHILIISAALAVVGGFQYPGTNVKRS